VTAEDIVGSRRKLEREIIGKSGVRSRRGKEVGKGETENISEKQRDLGVNRVLA
jgi:hypothetical protein